MVINSFNKWILFRGIVCESIISSRLDLEMFGGDVWEFSSCLDMSFDELKDKPVEMWWPIIQNDLFAYVADWKKQNSTNC